MAYRPNNEEMDEALVTEEISRFMEEACAENPAPAQKAAPSPRPRSPALPPSAVPSARRPIISWA